MIKIRRFIFFKIFKWKIIGNTDFPKKCVLIAAPHTHWIDFFFSNFCKKFICPKKREFYW